MEVAQGVVLAVLFVCVGWWLWWGVGGGGRGLCLLPYFRAACKGGA